MEPDVARPAATVLLVRDGPHGVQVYLQRRPRRFGFAGGLWVYPGGRVDEADADPAIAGRWSGPSPEAWARRLDCTVDRARAHVAAACRETLEEAGVLLGGPVPPATDLAAARRDLLAGTRTLAQTLDCLDVRLNTDRLRYWAWWVTPAGEPRRYDTRFFIAALPRDATVHAHTGEATDERWVDRRQPVADLPLLPPTHYTLRDITAFDTVADVLAAGRERVVDRIEPVLDSAAILLPWGDRYSLPDVRGHDAE
jgi:8-oxo-dGTP pyrophosphatase MutT (NUDIX family)